MAIFHGRQTTPTATTETKSSPSHLLAYQALIQAGPRLKPLQQVHAHLIVAGSHCKLPILTKLLTLACTAGSILYTRLLFLSIPNPDSYLFNSIIKASSKFHFPLDAVLFYRRMLIGHILPSNYTFTAVIKACSELSALRLGRVVHSHALVRGYDLDSFVQAALISFYAKCGELCVARRVFDKMPERTIISWNAMISGYEQNGFAEEAICLFCRMRDLGVKFDSATFDYDLVPGMEHHVCMVDMLGRAGFLNEAFQYIKELNPIKPAPAVWTAMLGACKMHKNFDLGVVVSEHLLAAEPENPSHYVLLSNIYALAGRMDRVETVRNMMIQKGLKKRVGYSTIAVNQKTHLFSMGDKSHPETIGNLSVLR
ncbi:hypothetical protein F0562_014110 [Nyssa sinensis]|uniref:Pentatricopeptide repeat-containing protein n=1 Tax=Nyssa sinensis TaxID=561372 RepID=A0A5J4ZMB8_9ASTE|nr:hypothetical protein F0562_014110 [Nyssa sinensis]